MTVIRNNSISGINSITAQSGALNFYDSTGNTLAISADVTGGVTVATGATISGSTNTITASTNGSERLRITSDGKVGVGEDNVQAHFHVAKNIADSDAINWTGSQLSVATPISGNSTANRATIYFAPYGSDNNYAPSAISASAGTSGASTLKFFTNASGNLTGQVQNYERLRITSGGDIQVANGNLVFSTAGTGIDFSNSGVVGSGTTTSSVLDDYEEGTWTPTFTGPGATFTYSSQQGNYIKIGTLVYAAFFVQISAVSGGSGTCGIGGLPFTTGNSASNPNPGGYIQLVGNWNTNHPDSLEANGASTTGLNLLYRSAANGTNNQAVPTSNFQANTFVRATIVYFSS